MRNISAIVNIIINITFQAGKTALVHSLAALTATQVDTLSLNVTTDTMELLGGFEQADLDRTIGSLWARVAAWVLGITEQLLGGGRTEDGLLFMQRFLQLDSMYKEASLKRKRSEQLKILNEVILSVRSTNVGVAECERLLVELGQLDTVQQV